MASLGAIVFVAIIAAQAAPEVDRSEIAQEIIDASRRSYAGSCPCPYDHARDGSRCGRRSAYSRPGGARPFCYESDVSGALIDAIMRAREAEDEAPSSALD